MELMIGVLLSRAIAVLNVNNLRKKIPFELFQIK